MAETGRKQDGQLERKKARPVKRLKESTRKELNSLARNLNIQGRSGMSKDELAEAIGEGMAGGKNRGVFRTLQPRHLRRWTGR